MNETMHAAARERIMPGDTVRHFKGNLYQVLCFALDSETQEEIRDLFLAKGVDVILGSHSHYVQKIDWNTERGTFIAYSLGDFVSDADRMGTEYGIILNVEITKDNVTGDAKITNCTYTPIFTVSEAGEALRVVRLREAIEAYKNNHLNKVTAETYEKMVYALGRVEARVNGE